MSKFIRSFEVFATSKTLGDTEAYPIQEGVWLRLEDYPSKEAFIADATKKVAVLTGEKNPTLFFLDWDFNNSEGLISENDIDEQLWYLMTISDTTLDKILAYRELFGCNDDETYEQSLVKADKQYVCHFDSVADMATHYLENAELEDNLLSVILPHVNLESLGASLLQDMKECDGYYFKV